MLSIGDVIRDKYKLVRLLGDGGMGAVYEARHELLGTNVAIKVLHSDLARRTGLVDRFIQEARVAALIKSPNVVHVTDVDRTENGIAYIVMELLQGEPLSAMLDRQGKVPVATACAYVGQILEALEAAHALGVVHRDLKPENVFVTYAGGKPILKLIDFGIAKLRSSEPGEKNLTVSGVTMGTAEYMAPEQAYSADQADARSDVYAVGVLLYEMIAAQRPVSGDDARVIALKVERGEVTPLVHAAPDVPREIAGLVHRAMAPRPELRFQSAAEMRIALEAAMSGKVAPIAALAAQLPAAPSPKGRTMNAAPMPAAFTGVPIEAAPRTERVGPLPAAMMPPAIAMPPAYAATGSPGVAPRARKRSGFSWMWVVVPLLLGGGVVAVVLAVNAERSEGQDVANLAAAVASAATTATPPTATAPVTPAAPAAPNAPIAPLNPSPYVPAPGGPSHAGDAGHATHAPSANPSAAPSASTNPFNPPFALPSALPFPTSADGGTSLLPFPIPTTFTMPTAIPSTFPFPFPGAAKQPEAPAGSSSAAPGEAR